ncbi:hypothetical protein AB0H07_47170 [Streptomyces sp. NPDC021354]|uniref:hypothetical protein n=1 Tax=Streptomyces sp. NPDC021354 TaxID=3154793 RepID=UPI0033DF07FA
MRSQLAANRTASPAELSRLAEIYDQLATAEPSLAEEHLGSAAAERKEAQEARHHSALYNETL